MAFAHEEMTLGRLSGAARVVDGNDRVAAAMSVVVLTTVDPLRLAPAVGTAAPVRLPRLA